MVSDFAYLIPFSNKFPLKLPKDIHQGFTLVVVIFTLRVFSAAMNMKKKIEIHFFHETVPVTYEPAVPVAVLNTALLYIKTRIFRSKNGTNLIKYKYKD